MLSEHNWILLLSITHALNTSWMSKTIPCTNGPFSRKYLANSYSLKYVTLVQKRISCSVGNNFLSHQLLTIDTKTNIHNKILAYECNRSFKRSSTIVKLDYFLIENDDSLYINCWCKVSHQGEFVHNY